jgi:hypothetical protein
MFLNRQIVNIWYVPRKDKLSKPDDVLSAAEKYIELNGPEAFEKLISKVFPFLTQFFFCNILSLTDVVLLYSCLYHLCDLAT